MARTGNKDAYNNARKFAMLRGLSLKNVATQAGLSINAIYSWQQYGVSKQSLSAVAKVLGVKPEDIYTETAQESVSTESARHTLDLSDLLDRGTPILFDGKPLDEIDRVILRRVLGHR